MGIADAGSTTHLQQRCRQAAGEIEHHESAARHRVFDVVAEEPEKPHVPEQVHPRAVQEHRGEDVDGLTAGIGEAHHPITHREPGAGRQRAGQLTRNQAEVADRGRERHRRSPALHQDPHQHVDGHQHHRHVGGSLRLVFVVIRNIMAYLRSRSLSRSAST